MRFMRIALLSIPCICLAAFVTQTWAATDEEPSIDKLLSKLPPPDKLASHPVQQAIQQNDPAFHDKLVQNILVAAKRRNIPEALSLCRKLATKYPNRAGAQCLRGMW